MSTIAQQRVSEDVRYELAEAARSAERANRPRSLLFLATVLFLVAGVALIVCIRHRDSALREFRIQGDWKVLVAGFEEQNNALDRLLTTDQSAVKPLADLFTRIESAAMGLGLEKPKIPPQKTPVRDGAALKNTYEYTMHGPDLGVLLTWIQQCLADVPGLRVAGLEIVPQAKAWQCKVTFVRWERAS
ncbi:MAG: hypothetical protein IPJ41_04145 [Phycisphaerales bacterium]|nr:hypothetical protein [Phycisphaerales bacterium]